MRLAPLFDQELEQKFREGEQQGEQRGELRGIQRERRTMIGNLLRFRFGGLDEELATVTGQILALSTEELTPLIFQLSQLSREDLLARFLNPN